MTSEAGGDLTNNSGNKFYGTGAQTCNTCPGPSNNDILPLPAPPVPLELLTFTVRVHTETATLLQWTTATEINVAHFEVQYLDKGDWALAGMVPAAGFSQQRQVYQWIDADAHQRLNDDHRLYYRLKMSDRDGSFVFSEIREVSFPAAARFALSPNPIFSGGELRLFWENKNSTSPVDWQIYNSEGRLVKQWTISETPMDPVPTVYVDLPAGLYLVQAFQDGRRWTQKLVVQD